MNTMTAIKEKPANIVIGTKYNMTNYTIIISSKVDHDNLNSLFPRFKPWSSSAIDDTQIKEFEDKWKVKVIRIDAGKSLVRSEMFDCSYQLSAICSILWNRDKEFISKLMGQV